MAIDLLWFSVACFGVRVSVTFHLMFVHNILVRFGLLSGYLLGKSCPLGWPYVLIVFCLFAIIVISRFGFEGWVWFLIVPVPVHCLLVSSMYAGLFPKRKYCLNQYSEKTYIYNTVTLHINC